MNSDEIDELIKWLDDKVPYIYEEAEAEKIYQDKRIGSNVEYDYSAYVRLCLEKENCEAAAQALRDYKQLKQQGTRKDGLLLASDIVTDGIEERISLAKVLARINKAILKEAESE